MGSKKKYYAIKKGNGVTNKIVDTWNECKALVLGYPAIYKSFKTEDEALEYLGLKPEECSVEEQHQDQVKKSSSKKKKGKNQRIVKVCLDKELYIQFIKECERVDMSEEMVIKNMIKEWLSC